MWCEMYTVKRRLIRMSTNCLKIFTFFAASLMGIAVFAADVVEVKISDGVYDTSVKSKMEQTISKILTEANEAHEEKREMNLSEMNIPVGVQKSLAALWDNSPFVSLDDEIVEHCITTNSGYQVRNIPLILKPFDMEETDSDDDYQEAVVNFDKRGNLTGFLLSISMNLYMNLIKENREITDLRRRELILDYVEQFRTAYNQKDLKFLKDIFSDDALIITGKVIQRKSMDGNIRLPDKVEYTKQSKKEYLTRLEKVFRVNKQIRVTFDEVEVTLHPTKVNIYGVTLHQGYTSDRYHDDGYLFLLWDFQDEDRPKIHVRTWQPDSYDTDGKKIRIPKDEIFTLSDFDL